jgi:quercetin dioxygenase-like cupin family protein
MGNIDVWEDAEPGVRRNIRNVGSGIMMMEVHFEPGAEGYEHDHPHEQMSYCLKGEIAFYIDGKETIVQAGDTIYVPSKARHSVKALKASALLDAFTPVREDLVRR